MLTQVHLEFFLKCPYIPPGIGAVLKEEESSYLSCKYYPVI
jgi:hypothetical protein